MKENYSFEIINGRSFAYNLLDDKSDIKQTIRLDNQDDLINIDFTEDNKIKDIEVTLINRSINLDEISIKRESIVKNDSLPKYQISNSEKFILNYSNGNLNIILSTKDNRIKSFYEDGTMTYYFNENNELVMIGKALGNEEKEYFKYILSPLPIDDPTKTIEAISEREGIDILEASFIGDESWEGKIVNSCYHLRFIYDDKDKPTEISYPYEKNVDIKGIGVRELFRRIENDDLESYEMLYSGYKLLTDDYVSQIRRFTQKNIHYNNILRKYLEEQKKALDVIKEGDIVPTNFLLEFLRRTQVMRRIEIDKKYPNMTYDEAFEKNYPYVGDLTPLKDTLLEYKKDNPLIVIDNNHIELMKAISDYTVPDNDDYNYDMAARDELLSKADDLSKKTHKKI
ncbi:MAG: hypothetical protein IIZ67_01855 [Bacilli bacterium]|nr:hypothetical protein [Bacilli bacterium]